MINPITPRFARREPLRHATALMAGVDSWPGRKNCRTVAEHRGDATPDGLQHLLARAKWDADAVRDDVRDYVVDAFGDPGAVLIMAGNEVYGTQAAGTVASTARAINSPARLGLVAKHDHELRLQYYTINLDHSLTEWITRVGSFGLVP